MRQGDAGRDGMSEAEEKDLKERTDQVGLRLNINFK